MKAFMNLLTAIMIAGFVLYPSAQAGVSIAGGQDFGFAKGQQYGEIRYSHDLYEFDGGNIFGASAYLGSMNTKGAGIYFKGEYLLFGIGVETADEDEDVVDTTDGYELRLEVKVAEHWSVGVKHRSNCSVVCREVPVMNGMKKGPEDKSNHGFNFVIVRYEF